MDESKIRLWRLKDGLGPMIPRKNYEHVASRIIYEVKSSRKGQIDLSHLIDLLQYPDASGMEGDIGWYILQVKQDLEARGIIKTFVNRDRVQTISLTKSVRKYKYKALGNMPAPIPTPAK